MIIYRRSDFKGPFYQVDNKKKFYYLPASKASKHKALCKARRWAFLRCCLF